MWTSIALAIIGSGLLTTIYTEWRTSRRSKEDKDTAERKMLLALGRERILVMSKGYKHEGLIPLDEYEAYDELVKAYEELGGNGAIRKLAEDVKSLPIESE